jgi:hypothetical protein
VENGERRPAKPHRKYDLESPDVEGKHSIFASDGNAKDITFLN